MDTCVRCGACADKCHFFLGTNDPKNMPVLRAELLRSVYRRDFTTAGRLLGKVGGARKLTTDVIKDGSPTSTSAPNAAAAPCSAPTASIPPKSRLSSANCCMSSASGINWIMEPGVQL